jgi:hypothetical protein
MNSVVSEFRRVEDFASATLIHALHVAVFERNGAAGRNYPHL